MISTYVFFLDSNIAKKQSEKFILIALRKRKNRYSKDHKFLSCVFPGNSADSGLRVSARKDRGKKTKFHKYKVGLVSVVYERKSGNRGCAYLSGR